MNESNPAVTIAFAVVRRFPWRHVPPYLVTQVAGALSAALLLQMLYGRDTAMRVSFGAHIPRVTAPQAIGFEIVFGFLLMLVIIAVATDKRVPGPVPGLAIGLTVALLIMFGEPMSGASMNPARSLGPALFGLPGHRRGCRRVALRDVARWAGIRAVRAGGSCLTRCAPALHLPQRWAP